MGIVAGAGQALAKRGVLIFCRSLIDDGRHTGEGNARFDAALRAENPDWGVRDTGEIAELAATAGLGPAEVTRMPPSNRLVTFAKRSLLSPW